jgi:hypothetical protein
MAEYIERAEIILHISSRQLKEIVPNCEEPEIREAVYKQGQAIKKMIENYPSADVVKVVRCKDCKYYVAEYCTRDIRGRTNMFYMKPNDYCSCGERKEEL